ncbi:Glycosyltransferase involved in cell wall bisynthesis [Rhizobium sp. RU33A]|uniref:glycosyltransferase family 4 protein n=1 Tax=Rhizobium sp. RU33A TaxID=1907413 RepID=UPI000955CE34|nr:glycosyltransferase family 4 protein [Rhizobium sp. RU33A]SIR14713.1 Glycosyltransferase involved in cell wall bisynthesis [Rhizobium sp. RU33A]
MRILIVTQYFWPESFIINDVARALAVEGHQVTVATGKPNYPEGRIAPGYSRKGTLRELYAGGIEVLRVPLRPRGDAGSVGLSLNYLSFVLSGLLHFPRMMRGKTFDVVLFYGLSPLTSAIPAAFMAWCKKAHLAYWVQDIWPDSLAVTGFVTNRFILSAVRQLMRILYWCAGTILVQSEALARPVAECADPRKIVYLPNPAPVEQTEDGPLPEHLSKIFDDCFPVVFAGNLGRAQSLETIVEAARLLQHEPRIRFIIAGAGSEAQWLKTKAASAGLENFVLVGHVDRLLMPAFFRRASALLVTLSNDPGISMIVPSKVQAYMQAGKPIIAALNGEGARIIREAGCGLVVASGDSRGLAESILTLFSLPVRKQETMGSAGKRYFESHFHASGVVHRLIAILESRMGVRQSEK